MILHLPTFRRREASAVATGLAIVLLLAACGGGTGSGNDGVVSLQTPVPSSGASAAPSASLDPEEAMLAFERCMKDHGIDVHIATSGNGSTSGGVTIGGPQPAGGGPGAAPQTGGGPTDAKALEAADKACRPLLPSGMQKDPSATIPPEQVDAMLAFAKCMRDHGVDMPDPQFNDGGMTVQIGNGDGKTGPDPNSKTFQDAQTACAKQMPSGAPVFMGGTSTQAQP
jgi:hypothetical protein